MNNCGERIKSARLMQGLSLQELADLLGNKITKQALGKYELGQVGPSPEMIIEISNVLKVRPDFFTREKRVEIEGVEFRKLQRTSEKEVVAVKERTREYLERYFELEDITNTTSVFKNPISDIAVNSLEDIEKAAEKLRKVWKLGEDPIYNVVELLEEKGIKVFETIAPEEFDGFAGWTNHIPVVVINSRTNAGKLDRKRMTALHELAHLVLQLPEKIEHKTKEQYCYAFAAAFMFPQASFVKAFGNYRSQIIYKELVLLKEEWGISVSAIIMRAKNLGLITPHVYANFWKEFAHFKKDEPGNYKGEEKSYRFNQLLLRALAEEAITLSKAAALNSMKVAELRDFLEKYD